MNARYKNLLDSMTADKPVLIDGATGTEAERRGVPRLDNAWNGGGVLTHPEVVVDVHEDYIKAGAKIIISNTFATHRSVLEDAGVSERFEDSNRAGVELAIKARSNLGADDVLVAGGMSHWSFTGNKPTIARLHENAVEQANIMAAAGADFLMLEMMIDIDRMIALTDAALATGLPTWIGLTCKIDEHDRVVLRNGESIADTVAQINTWDIPVVNIMHTEVDIVARCLEELRQHYHGHVGVYAHTGEAMNNAWIFDGVISPEGYGEFAQTWRQYGISAVGGCCGLGPQHIHHLREQLQAGSDV